MLTNNIPDPDLLLTTKTDPSPGVLPSPFQSLMQRLSTIFPKPIVGTPPPSGAHPEPAARISPAVAFGAISTIAAVSMIGGGGMGAAVGLAVAGYVLWRAYNASKGHS